MIVKIPFGILAYYTRVRGFGSTLCSSFLLTHVLGGSRWCRKSLSPCQTPGRPGLRFRLLDLPWSCLAVVDVWGMNEWMADSFSTSFSWFSLPPFFPPFLPSSLSSFLFSFSSFEFPLPYGFQINKNIWLSTFCIKTCLANWTLRGFSLHLWV